MSSISSPVNNISDIISITYNTLQPENLARGPGNTAATIGGAAITGVGLGLVIRYCFDKMQKSETELEHIAWTLVTGASGIGAIAAAGAFGEFFEVSAAVTTLSVTAIGLFAKTGYNAIKKRWSGQDASDNQNQETSKALLTKNSNSHLSYSV